MFDFFHGHWGNENFVRGGFEFGDDAGVGFAGFCEDFGGDGGSDGFGRGWAGSCAFGEAELLELGMELGETVEGGKSAGDHGAGAGERAEEERHRNGRIEELAAVELREEDEEGWLNEHRRSTELELELVLKVEASLNPAKQK